jgi:transposase InsO family protein
VFVAHGRRELVHFAVTAHPTAAWVWRQLINATPWGQTPAYLVRDRDAGYGADFVRKAAGLGIRTLLTPVRAPRANTDAERLVGTLRRECLDHAIAVFADPVALDEATGDVGIVKRRSTPHDPSEAIFDALAHADTWMGDVASFV